MHCLLLLWVVVATHCAIYTKLTTLRPTSFTPKDYLVSTLGRFRLTLAPNTCQLAL